MPRTRVEALSIGLRHYFTGEPCARGHLSARYARDGSCIACTAARSKEWASSNPDKCNAASQAYRDDNRHKRNDKARAKWEDDRAPLLEKKRARYAANREKIGEQNRAWSEANPERVRCRVRNCRARRRAAAGSHSVIDIAAIRKMQRDRCAMPDCQANLDGCGHVDHIASLKRGGSNAARNLQLLCAPCNQSKSARDPIEFSRSRGLLL